MSAVANILVCHSCIKRARGICAVSGKPFAEHAEAHTCPEARFPARGLGDIIEKAIHRTGIDKVVGAIVGPCEPEPEETFSPCQKRRNWLNSVLQNEGSD